MAGPYTFGQPTTVLTDIGGIQLDAVMRESHRFENRVTQFPVESGADLTDHIIVQPLQFSLEGIITDTPLEIGSPEGETTPGRAKEAYNNLESLFRLKTKFDVVHGLGIYRNLVFITLEFPREAGMGRRILVRAVLREVRTARTDSRIGSARNVDDSVRHSAPQPIDFGYQPTLGIA